MAPCRFAPGWRRAHATGATWLLAISMSINQAHQGTHVGPLRGPGGCVHPTTACHASPPSATRRRGGPRPPQVVPWVNMGSYVAVTGTQVCLGIARVGEPAPPISPVAAHLRFETPSLNERWPLWGPKRASPVPGALSVSTGSDALPLRTCRRLRERGGLRRRRIPRAFGHGSIVEDGSWVGVRKALCCGPSAVVRRGTDLHSAAGGVCLRRTRRSMSGDRSVTLERRLLAPDTK